MGATVLVVYGTISGIVNVWVTIAFSDSNTAFAGCPEYEGVKNSPSNVTAYEFSSLRTNVSNRFDPFMSVIVNELISSPRNDSPTEKVMVVVRSRVGIVSSMGVTCPARHCFVTLKLFSLEV